VSGPCLRIFRALAAVGAFVSLAAMLAFARVLWTFLRTGGRRSSLALRAVVGLRFFFCALFALVYPFDVGAVLKPQYMLPLATPLAACLSIALAELPDTLLAHGLVLAALGVVGILVLVERMSG
jgi:4-amino-4-deoxy-L-arabinose transferase-like glycosyltransferase